MMANDEFVCTCGERAVSYVPAIDELMCDHKTDGFLLAKGDDAVDVVQIKYNEAGDAYYYNKGGEQVFVEHTWDIRQDWLDGEVFYE